MLEKAREEKSAHKSLDKEVDECLGDGAFTNLRYK